MVAPSATMPAPRIQPAIVLLRPFMPSQSLRGCGGRREGPAQDALGGSFKQRVAAGRVAVLAADEDAAVMLGQHDDDGVDAREMVEPAAGAAAAPAGAEETGGRSASSAEQVAVVPFDEAARRAPDRRFLRPHQRQ